MRASKDVTLTATQTKAGFCLMNVSAYASSNAARNITLTKKRAHAEDAT